MLLVSHACQGWLAQGLVSPPSRIEVAVRLPLTDKERDEKEEKDNKNNTHEMRYKEAGYGTCFEKSN